jgi:2-hydroxy-3-keto-5-methylthiopentenyl-1-phosphate phosphatase
MSRQRDADSPKWQALVDFDGTIAPDDPTDRLFERFADPLWRVVEVDWQAGRISSRECMQRQVRLLRASPEELDAAISEIRLDPGFPAFLKFCSQHGGEVKIVSDGLDRVVAAALRRAGLAVPYFANKLEWDGGDRWRLAYPHARSDCRVDGANCKCAHGKGSLLRVVIGDGRSDFCMSRGADFVIAKGALAGHCRTHGLPHAVFEDFHEATARLAAWFAKPDRTDSAPDVLRPLAAPTLA